MRSLVLVPCSAALALCVLFSTATGARSEKTPSKSAQSTSAQRPVSRSTGAQSPPSASAAFMLRTSLTPAVRATLRARIPLRRPDTSGTAPLAKFAATNDEAWRLIIAYIVGLNIRITNGGTATLLAQTAAAHIEAVDLSGQTVAVGHDADHSMPAHDLSVGQTAERTFLVRIADKPDLGQVPFRSLPTFVAWITGVPNDGRVAIYEPDYVQKVSTPGSPASAGVQLGFVAGGSTQFQGRTLKTCYQVKNKGGAASSAALVKTALRQKQGTLVTTDTTIPAMRPGTQTELCVALPDIPGGPLWTEITPLAAKSGEYDFQASIVGAPNDGSTANIKVFSYTYRVETL
jgi:hypothetical protein